MLTAVFDVIFFQILLAAAFPVYVVWLGYYFGTFAITILGATLAGYVVLDGLVFVSAATIGMRTPLWLIAYLPLYTVLQTLLVRPVRLVAEAGRELGKTGRPPARQSLGERSVVRLHERPCALARHAVGGRLAEHDHRLTRVEVGRERHEGFVVRLHLITLDAHPTCCLFPPNAGHRRL